MAAWITHSPPRFWMSGTTSQRPTGTASLGIALQNDGRIVEVGEFHGEETLSIYVQRYELGGSLDTSFGTGGTVTTDVDPTSDNRGDGPESVVIGSDGKILTLVSGVSGFVGLMRYQGGPPGVDPV